MHHSFSDAAHAAVTHVRSLSGGRPVDRNLRVTLNFHPDRLTNGRPILVAMAGDGTYRSQFETGTSNGGLTAHPGGDRWLWEQRIFGQAYDDAPAAERPKYGALNHRNWPVGGSPRFGSAHLRLRPEVLDRSTFCFPDSFYEPTLFGVGAACDLEAMHAFGTETESGREAMEDLLDDYVEAHAHGVLSLADDVEALVLDPSFRGTPIEEQAKQLPVPIEWHPGFAVHRDVLAGQNDYRGPQFVALALDLLDAAGTDVLVPTIIGDASRAGSHDEQSLKRVWHLLARFGSGETMKR